MDLRAHVGDGLSELPEAEKEIYRAGALRRRERGIRLKKICMMAEESQVEAFAILWESFVERWGKRRAVDVLLKGMAEIEVSVRDAEAAKATKGKSK